jgi:hypothetical protein
MRQCIVIISAMFLAFSRFSYAQENGNRIASSDVEAVLELVINSQPFDSLITMYFKGGEYRCDSIILDTLFMCGNENLSIYRDSIKVRFLGGEDVSVEDRPCFIEYNDFLIMNDKGRIIMDFPRNWKTLWIGFYKENDKWVLGKNHMIADY